MKYSNPVRLIALASLLAALAGWQPALAQGASEATMTVGITIVGPTAADAEITGPRIPVDPTYAVDSAEPLRQAQVEQVALVDGSILQVVSY